MMREIPRRSRQEQSTGLLRQLPLRPLRSSTFPLPPLRVATTRSIKLWRRCRIQAALCPVSALQGCSQTRPLRPALF